MAEPNSHMRYGSKGLSIDYDCLMERR